MASATSIEWREYVKEAQKEVLAIKQSRMRIAALALKACTILPPGGDRNQAVKNEVYTLKRFAEDIGMEPGTLRRWVKVKVNVVDKLKDYSDFEPGSYLAAERTLVALATKDPIDKAPKGARYRAPAPAEKVRKIFNEIKERNAAPGPKTVNSLERYQTQAEFLYRQVNKLSLSPGEVGRAESLADTLEAVLAKLRDKALTRGKCSAGVSAQRKLQLMFNKATIIYRYVSKLENFEDADLAVAINLADMLERAATNTRKKLAKAKRARA